MRYVRTMIVAFGLFSLLSIGATKNDSKFAFKEQLLSNEYGYAFGANVADLDGDGDLDITSTDAVKNTLSWYQNDGQAKFQCHFIRSNEPGWFERHAIGDIDRDGKLDIVALKNLHGQIVWFRNTGKPCESTNWQRHVLTDKLPGAYDVALVDFDQDGDLDVAASSWIKAKRFEWFENDGSPVDGMWKGRIIESGLKETREVRPADIDGDGDLELVATETVGDLLMWYENEDPSKDQVWKRHIIDNTTKRPTHGQVLDIDADGDIDVLMAFGSFVETKLKTSHQVAWYENRGGQWKKHFICRLPSANAAMMGDLDADGDLDVVACAWGADSGQVICVENVEGPSGKWKPHPLKPRWPKACGVYLADFNGDGRLDIVGSAERGSNEVRCWINVGR